MGWWKLKERKNRTKQLLKTASESTIYINNMLSFFKIVCCVAVRNCLECRQRQRDRGNKSSHGSSKPQEAPQGVTATAASKVIKHFLS